MNESSPRRPTQHFGTLIHVREQIFMPFEDASADEDVFNRPVSAFIQSPTYAAGVTLHRTGII